MNTKLIWQNNLHFQAVTVKKLRKKLRLIYVLLILMNTQEKIIFYARLCHMHDVKKLKMLKIFLTIMKFSL
jgi:hypothetical protein